MFVERKLIEILLSDKMNSVVMLIGLMLCVLSVVSAQKYTTKYDNVNYEDIFKSERLLNNYYKCLLDKGKCTPEGNELKRTLPDALQTNCSKCSPKQRDGAERAIRYLVDNRPVEWNALQQKFDPQNIYAARYANEAQSRNIRI